MSEAPVLVLLEHCRQLLGCQTACFLPGCPDPTLRHPWLDIIEENCWPVLYQGGHGEPGTRLAGPCVEEPVRALCDLAMQSGRMQVLAIGGRPAECWHWRSVAALPLERPAGTLGTFLLADEHTQRFGRGEEVLLYAYLSMYGAKLERALKEMIRETLLRSASPFGGNGEHTSMPSASFGAHEFVSVVGHELRAPLSIIKGYAGLLQAYGDAGEGMHAALTSERRRHYLSVVVEQTGLLELLVNDLLDLARLQRGRLVLRPQVVDVGALCRRVVQLGQLRADQSEPGKYQLAYRLSAQLPPMLMDAERLQQVLLNIIENAIKYSPQGGHITVEVDLLEEQGRSARQLHGQRGQACVLIVVSDQGIGIPAHSCARLFQPFERLDRRATSHIQGTGLGLYIARQLIAAMDGTVEICSCEGYGTDVTITLPAISPQGEGVPGTMV